MSPELKKWLQIRAELGITFNGKNLSEELLHFVEEKDWERTPEGLINFLDVPGRGLTIISSPYSRDAMYRGSISDLLMKISQDYSAAGLKTHSKIFYSLCRFLFPERWK